MNVVLLCKDESEGATRILQALGTEGVVVQTVLAEIRPKSPLTVAGVIRRMRGRTFPELLRKALGLPGDRRKVSRGNIASEARQIRLSEYAQREGIAYVRVADLNGPDAIDLLQRSRPDLLVLGGTRIIRRRVLAIPRLGTVNAHMGLLPNYRGMNVSEWSAFNGDPVGVTVHFVDEGVDTGDILSTEVIDVTDCPSIQRLRAKVGRQQFQVLARCVRTLTDGSEPRPMAQGLSEGKQYYVMHPRLRAMLETSLLRTCLNREAEQARSMRGRMASSEGR
jgi:methionyl-tRNA formyltransferase